MDADGSNLTSVTNEPGALNIRPQWSHDGATLYFYQVRPRPTFRSISLSGGPSREMAPWSYRRQYGAAVDPRGRTAVYTAVDGQAVRSRLREHDTGRETTLPFAMYEHRFSRDGRLVIGESRGGALMLCEVSSSRCDALTPDQPFGLNSADWSEDGSRLFFVRLTSAGIFGEVMSVGVHGGELTMHGTIGPFQHRIHVNMGVSPHGEIIFAPFSEGRQELWMAKLR